MNNEELTPIQKETLEVFRQIEKCRVPTIRDIAEARGISVNGARCALDRLKEKGYLVRIPGAQRGFMSNSK